MTSDADIGRFIIIEYPFLYPYVTTSPSPNLSNSPFHSIRPADTE